MLQVKASLSTQVKNDVLVLFATQKQKITDMLPAAYASLSQECGSLSDFKGDKGEKRLIYVHSSPLAKKIILYGIGPKAELSLNSIKLGICDLYKYASGFDTRMLSLFYSQNMAPVLGLRDFAALCTECAFLALYSFTKYKTGKDSKTKRLPVITVLVKTDKEKTDMQRQIKNSTLIARRVLAARDLINEPPNELTPARFATRVVEEARRIKLSTLCLSEKDIRKKKMGGLLAVARGSVHKPYFLVLHHKGAATKKKKTICFVGKGVCFDSGGLSLKPAMSMVTMKYDMAGAATCAQVVLAAHELGLKHEVIALLPLCENLPDGNAYRPGDVIRTLSGKTVEIFNTDAEGRMILADALHYSGKYSPDILIDVATLTGAAKVCLGDKAAAVLGNDESLLKTLIHNGQRVGERLWQLPLWDDYQDDLKSEIADMKNIGLKGAGTITAAKFLANFIPDTAWAHLDIASVAWEDEGKAHAVKGASGFGVRLLIDFLMSL
jgi:leucyl aminopeptidase